MTTTTTSPPVFTVVIPTFRRRRSLELVLRGVGRQTWPHDALELIVVSDGADDGSAELARSFPMPFTIRVFEQANQGPAAARNLGLANARGQFVLFIDDDVVPSPELVLEHARAHEEAPNSVVIGPMLQAPGRLLPWIRWESRTLGEQYEAMMTGKWAPTPWQFYTGNASVRLEHLRQAGGFDVRYRRAEDIELAFRLARFGLSFVFRPGACGTHIAQRSYNSWLDAGFQYGRNDILFGTGEERVAPEFRHRHPLTRRLVFWAIRHPPSAGRLAALSELPIRTADAVGLHSLSDQVCGAVFNMEYWLGVSEQLGSAAETLGLARLGSPPGLLSRIRSALPIGLRHSRR